MRRDGFRMSEADIQAAIIDLVEVFKRPRLKYWHTPNGGKRHIKTAMKFKRQGVKAGVPDLIFVVPPLAGSNEPPFFGFLEVKTPKGKMSPAQQEFRDWCLEVGIRHEVVTNAADAMAILYGWGALLPVAYKRGQG